MFLTKEVILSKLDSVAAFLKELGYRKADCILLRVVSALWDKEKMWF